MELSARYINDRKLPDKAIDVIDEVGAMQMLVPPSRRKKVITPKEIEQVVATTASISLVVIVFLRRDGGTSICIAPTSSITSIALSGNLRSWM